MKTYVLAVVVTMCLAIALPCGDAFAAGTGKFGDEVKVGYTGDIFSSRYFSNWSHKTTWVSSENDLRN